MVSTLGHLQVLLNHMVNKRKKLEYYPLAISLRDKKVVVVGGGAVAERKIELLLKAQALVRVVSPTLTPTLRQLAMKKRINWSRRLVRKSDVAEASIVIAATNSAKTNTDISRWAKKRKAWVNVVDKPSLSDFISPAVLHQSKTIIAVYTDGNNPVLSRDLKNFLKERWDEFLRYRNRL